MGVGRQVEGEEGNDHDEEGGQVEPGEVVEEAPLEEDVQQEVVVGVEDLPPTGVPEDDQPGQGQAGEVVELQGAVLLPAVPQAGVGA